MSTREIDPYKGVWDTVDNSVTPSKNSNVNVVKHGDWVFVPTWEEMAFRHKSVTRHLLAKARSLFRMGKVTESHSIFNDALKHRRIARFCLDKHLEVLLKSR